MSTNVNENNQEEVKKNIGIGAFMGSTIISSLAVIIYFALGSIFLYYSNFYSKFKMNSRFVDNPPYTTNMPFKNVFTDSKNNSLFTRFMQWLTFSVIYSFANCRYLLDKFFDLVGTALKDAPGFVSTLTMLAGPFLMIGIVFSSFFVSFGATIIGGIKNIGLIIPNALELIVLILPLLIPLFIYPGVLVASLFSTAGITSIYHVVLTLGFLLLAPLINEKVREGIITTLLDNINFIVFTIFCFVTINSFVTLDNTYGYISLGISLAALLSFIFFKFF
jgi:hypothetical protein